MATLAPTRLDLFAILREELAPYDGRLGLSLRMALLCVMVTVTAMALQVPEAALSCYLIFFASKDNAGSGIALGIALIVGASVGILLGVLFLMVVADDPMLRLIFMAAFTFGGMFLSQASKGGSIAATVGFVFAFVMTLYDYVPLPDLLIRALAWMWVVVFFPMAYLIGLNAIAGRNPVKLARNVIASRLEVAARLAAGDTTAVTEAAALLAKGNEALETYQKMGRLLSLVSKREALRLGEMGEASYRLLVLARTDPAVGPALVEMAKLVRRGRLLPALPDLPPGPARDFALVLSAAHEPVPPPPAEAEPILAADAFTNPAYTRFALKTLLAVLICYMTYTSFGWFEFHTAMITCFYVALGTTGQTVHKLTLRITGCLIGAAMGVGSIIYLMPHMTDIGQLALLIGAGSFIAAWVANSSERLQYMGWQMALAFFLCVLHGYGPTFDLDVARDRIIGIIYGNVVVTIVFSSLWPVSVGSTVRKHLAAAMRALVTLVGGRAPVAAPAYASFFTGIEAARRGQELVVFEIDRVRRREQHLNEAAQVVEPMTRLAKPLIALAELNAGAPRLKGAPHSLRRATLRFETGVERFLSDDASYILGTVGARATVPDDAALRSLERLFLKAKKSGALAAGPRIEMSERMELYRAIQGAIDQM